MPNFIKKIEKAKNNELAEGETVQAALIVNDAGAIAGSAVTGGVGGIFGFFMGRKVQNSANEKHQTDSADSDMVKMIPSGQTIIGITNQRIVIYSWDAISGKAKKLIGEMKLGDIKVVESKKGKMISKVTLGFGDGGRKTYDALKGNNLEEFERVAG